MRTLILSSSAFVILTDVKTGGTEEYGKKIHHYNFKFMAQSHPADKDGFLYPRTRYQGQVKPENLVFNANLQEFAQKVSYITAFETRGKLSPVEAYEQIKNLWDQLKYSKNGLGIDPNDEYNIDS